MRPIVVRRRTLTGSQAEPWVGGGRVVRHRRSSAGQAPARAGTLPALGTVERASRPRDR
ncbi:MAG TPA: hypothetical protein VM076_25415 [Gemmatimonadaceae bacterium]|nr:hypothetical protein [Gemmatimonadaceae bacterium]